MAGSPDGTRTFVMRGGGTITREEYRGATGPMHRYPMREQIALRQSGRAYRALLPEGREALILEEATGEVAVYEFDDTPMCQRTMQEIVRALLTPEPGDDPPSGPQGTGGLPIGPRQVPPTRSGREWTPLPPVQNAAGPKT